MSKERIENECVLESINRHYPRTKKPNLKWHEQNEVNKDSSLTTGILKQPRLK